MSMLTLILATWRLTSLLHREQGPANIFGHWRHWLGVRYDEQSQPYATTNLSEGVLCFWCCSVWGALVLSSGGWLADRGRHPWLWLLRALAASTGAIVLEEWFNAQS